MKCIHCRQQIDNDSTYCAYCGQLQNKPASPTPTKRNIKFKEFKPASLKKVLKKLHYPFQRVEVEPISPLKGSIAAEGEAAGYNLTFLLLHGIFMLGWYSAVLGAYCWYLLGYTVYWLIANLISLVKILIRYNNKKGG